MRQHRVFYGSSYDRGLEHLLKMWPSVKEKFPDATLDIAYGWNLFDKAYRDNPERMNWKQRMQEMMQADGVTEHGRLGKQDLSLLRKSCGIWAYPTHFAEINCITALEAQYDGLIPVVINYAALAETVGSGAKIHGDIFNRQIRQQYLEKLLQVMSWDKQKVRREREQAKNFAKSFSWDKVAREWASLFDKKRKKGKSALRKKNRSYLATK